MPRSVVVLGMHRSGTSCIARILNHLGVYLGDNVERDPVPSNLLGHWEARDAVAINDEILRLSQGAWDRVPEQLTWNLDCEEKIKQFLSALATHPAFGWKDPRTTLTFPAWKPHLDDYLVLACIRHPLAVARSLEVRDGLTAERGLELWAAYNGHLLRHVSDEQRVLWFPYDESPRVVHAHLRRLCEALQRPFGDDVTALFNPYLSHARGDDRHVPPETLDLYRALLDRASNALHTDPVCSSLLPGGAHAAAAVENNSTAEVATRDRHLEEVVRNFGAAQQTYWRIVFDAQRSLADNLERKLHQHAAAIAEQARVDREKRDAIEQRLRRQIEQAGAQSQQLAALQQHLIVRQQQLVDQCEQTMRLCRYLEERVAHVEALSQRSRLRQLLARIPGVRPIYLIARRVLLAGG